MVDNLENVVDFTSDATERVKRSQALLEELYHQEINPRYRASPPRIWNILLLVSAAAVLLFTGTLFYKFNSFVYLREDVLAKQGNLEAAVQRRSNLFSNLVELTLSHAALESAIYSYAAEMRTKIIKKSSGSERLADALKTGAGKGAPNDKPGSLLGRDWTEALKALGGDGMNTSLGRLLAVVEQYPNVRISETYKQMMGALVEMENRISAKRMEYNMSMRQYNTSISKFPWKLLAKLTNFARLDYYSTPVSKKSAPIITPDIYQQLVPLVAAKQRKQ